MRTTRPALAIDPRRFGRRPLFAEEVAHRPAALFSEDVRLFAATFTAGFLFVSVLIA